MHARFGEHPIVVLRTLAFKYWSAAVGGRTSFDAVVTPSTSIGIDHHSSATIHQSLLDQKLEQSGIHRVCIQFKWRINDRLSELVTRCVKTRRKIRTSDVRQYMLVDNLLGDAQSVNISDGPQRFLVR